MDGNKIFSRSGVFGLAVLLLPMFATQAMGDGVTSFDEIEFWIGEGENRAAMVIDWNSQSMSDESLAWGYRWSESASGEDMLRAILAADDRLFAKLGISQDNLGTPLFGWGYDKNNDQLFVLDDATSFDANGIAFTSPPDNPPPAAQSLDSEDLYAEGWFTGFWNYGVAEGNPLDGGNWVSYQQGMTNRVLTDGDWDGWTFSDDFNFSAFPANVHAAEAQPTADFDLDGDVDGHDFLVWQRGFGTTGGALPSQGDATRDGMVDHLDFQQWAHQFGSTTSSSGFIRGALQGTSVVVPEPGTACSIFWIVVAGSARSFFTRFPTKRGFS